MRNSLLALGSITAFRYCVCASQPLSDPPQRSTRPAHFTFERYRLYQSTRGVAVSIRIQNYEQHTLMFDATIAATAFNSGLPLSDFTDQLSNSYRRRS
jgi:hypothetical protein